MTFRTWGALGLCIGCGSIAAPTFTIPTSSSDFPSKDPQAVAYDPRLGQLQLVPGGVAQVGDWLIDGGALVTPPCELNEAPPQYGAFNDALIVAPFELMVTEVTNSEYAICVRSGACLPPDLAPPVGGVIPNPPVDWQSPDEGNRPVALNWGLARAFCLHYGGDLPTSAQFARAMVGDGLGYTTPPLFALSQNCAIGPGTSECGHVAAVGAEVGITPGSVLDVGTDPADLGVYGHYDLFANALEWERNQFVGPVCGTLLDHDVSVVDPGASEHGFRYGGGLINALRDDFQDVSPDGYSPRLPDPLLGTPYMGFRCAFPTP